VNSRESARASFGTAADKIVQTIASAKDHSMSEKNETNPILISTYSKDAPKAARFGVGASNRAEIEQAADAGRAQSDALKPRTYSTR
jgi:hypothetical protein